LIRAARTGSDVNLHGCSARAARAIEIVTTFIETSKKLGGSAYSYFRERISGSWDLSAVPELLH
jgi:hypothetical protein